MYENESYVSIKEDFPNKTCRLLNPIKSVIVDISETILGKI